MSSEGGDESLSKALGRSALPILGYWNFRGKAEPIRLLLRYAGEKYTDRRYQVGPPPTYCQSEWHEEKEKMGLLAPNLPYWIEPGGIALTQTHTILMYLGEKFGLAGKNPTERIKAMMATEVMEDWMTDFFAVTHCNAPWLSGIETHVHQEGEHQAQQSSPKFEELRKEYLMSTLPMHLNHIVAMLGQSAHGWIAGTLQPTYADFVLGEYLDQHLIFEPSCLDSETWRPIHNFLSRFSGLPSVSAYRRSDAFKPEPLHNVYSHFHMGWVSRSDSTQALRSEGSETAQATSDLEAAAASAASGIPTVPPPTVASKPTPPTSRRTSSAYDVVALAFLVAVLLAIVLLSRHVITFNDFDTQVVSLAEHLDEALELCGSAGASRHCAQQCCAAAANATQPAT